jgi:hypothetical protein
MSDLDRRIREALDGSDAFALNDNSVYLDRIKQAFIDAGWVTPENAVKVQNMVNQITNLANDMHQLPAVLYVKPNESTTQLQNLMTGQEWYERFGKALAKQKPREWYSGDTYTPGQVMKAAKKASGIKKGE